MTKEIPGVPESITRDAYIAMFKSIGLAPWDLTELSFRADGVYATVFARDEHGNKTLDEGAEGFHKHSIYIPVEG
jgi:hypothetical protein